MGLRSNRSTRPLWRLSTIAIVAALLGGQALAQGELNRRLEGWHKAQVAAQGPLSRAHIAEGNALIDELRSSGHYSKIWQAFAVLLPVKAVGVMGDERTYENVCALRAVTSTDGMTADWYDLPRDVLTRCSNRIINEVRGINRVVYDISTKPPGTIEWE